MALAIKPALQRSFGNDGWGFAVAVANIQVPKLTELDALTNFNLSCSLFGEQGDPTANQEKVTLPRILCETQQYEVNGTVTFAMPDLIVSFSPQAAAASDGKKAWETMVDQLNGFLWRRQNVAARDELDVGQFVDIIPVQLGVKVPGKTSTGADGVYSFTQGASITGAPAWNVEIVAGP
ncbi:hypothetical protein KVF89_22370 [Nocardioides carbamazepini]|uniref:phage tail tube protein n=1 Tax=Nocardioides carbamazepini TaxID=2854259 RepID=UPI00214A7065|nr:hypothetical protein [Nocardioides carbamazepini]MCR1785302.1 hypothetical protein [Nocardioides carbamazepini]